MTSYLGWSHDEAEKSLEKFGNKVAFEKKLNIQAGNGYFGKKKLKYAESAIANVKKLSAYSKDDWHKADIDAREKEFIAELMTFFSTNLNGTVSA
jgi:hypothetical protein